MSQEFGVPLTEVHFDPTHIPLFIVLIKTPSRAVGVVGDKKVRSDDQLNPAQITKGRGTDDAPDGALMVHAGICTVVDEFGPVPFFGHIIDGNQNGHTAAAEQLALYRKHLRPTKLTMISDRGTFSVGHLLRLQKEKFHALCSAPWHEFRPLFDEQRTLLKWKKASYLSIEQQRRRKDQSDLPLEHYELAEVEHTLMIPRANKPFPYACSSSSAQPIRESFASSDKNRLPRFGRDWSTFNVAWPPEIARPTPPQSPAASKGCLVVSKQPAISRGRWCR